MARTIHQEMRHKAEQSKRYAAMCAQSASEEARVDRSVFSVSGNTDAVADRYADCRDRVASMPGRQPCYGCRIMCPYCAED